MSKSAGKIYQGYKKVKKAYTPKNTKNIKTYSRKSKRITTYARGGKEWQERQLFKETKKKVQQANERLKSLEKRYKSGTWASKKLENRLSGKQLGVWKNGRIVLNEKKLTNTKLRAIQKATTQFLESKTSTKKGISSQIKATKGGIQELLSLEGKDFSSEDAEFFYDMLGEDDFDYFASRSSASSVWIAIDDAIDHSDSESKFIQRLEDMTQISMQDLDVRERAIRIYNKYVL